MFIAHEVAIQLVGSLRGSLDRPALKDAALADQLRRAASSVLLDIAEGARRAGKDRAYHYRVAAGSAAEVGAALDVAAAWGCLEEARLDEVRRLVDRELGLLWASNRLVSVSVRVSASVSVSETATSRRLVFTKTNENEAGGESAGGSPPADSTSACVQPHQLSYARCATAMR